MSCSCESLIPAGVEFCSSYKSAFNFRNQRQLDTTLRVNMSRTACNDSLVHGKKRWSCNFFEVHLPAGQPGIPRRSAVSLTLSFVPQVDRLAPRSAEPTCGWPGSGKAAASAELGSHFLPPSVGICNHLRLFVLQRRRQNIAMHLSKKKAFGNLRTGQFDSTRRGSRQLRADGSHLGLA